jgi:MFS family permease
MSIISTMRGTSPAAVPALLRTYGWRAWITVALATAASLLVIGIPTRLIDNGWFVRMTPTRPQDYAFWAVSAVLIGLIAGSYTAGRTADHQYKVLSSGMFSYLAVGCPICNKLVVLLLGVSGAMTYFAPAQLFIGLGSIALLGWTLMLRARVLTGACEAPVLPAEMQASSTP